MTKSDKDPPAKSGAPKTLTESKLPAEKKPADVTDPAVVIRKITGRGMVGCKKTAEKLSAGERSDLVKSYNDGKEPRSVLQKALDRIADEKIESAKKDADKS